MTNIVAALMMWAISNGLSTTASETWVDVHIDTGTYSIGASYPTPRPTKAWLLANDATAPRWLRERQEQTTGTSGHAFAQFKTLTSNTLNVIIADIPDLVGKADDILIAANAKLAQHEANVIAASNPAETKTAILGALNFMADLHRIELFMDAIIVRQRAGK